MTWLSNTNYPPHVDGQPSAPRQAWLFIWETIKVILLSLAIIIPVRYFLIKPFYVKGASMEPTFHNQDYLIIDELTYRFQQPQRGDVVVFKDPYDPKQYFIKRVIGLPGERVVIASGTVAIQKVGASSPVTLIEPYLPADLETSGAFDAVIPANRYFVLGDNRPYSLDSRVFQSLDAASIVGRVWWRGWPVDKIGFIHHIPDYQL